MSVASILAVLSTVGETIAKVGNLMTRLGFALSPPNLGGEQTELDLDIPGMRQDPLAHGAKDEKPEIRPFGRRTTPPDPL
jgi:hypothetical protein